MNDDTVLPLVLLLQAKKVSVTALHICCETQPAMENYKIKIKMVSKFQERSIKSKQKRGFIT